MWHERIAPNPRLSSDRGGRFAPVFQAKGPVWTIQSADGNQSASLTSRDQMKQFLLKCFTWWSSQTFGTQLWTWRFGELVGTDEQGNRYYRTKGRKIDPTLGFERRWATYNGYAEAPRVPPEWHGWLHHTLDLAP